MQFWNVLCQFCLDWWTSLLTKFKGVNEKQGIYVVHVSYSTSYLIGPFKKEIKLTIFLPFDFQYGFQSVMSVNDSIKAILLCLKVNSRKTQALVLRVSLRIA